jgi:hypothetical protein
MNHALRTRPTRTAGPKVALVAMVLMRAAPTEVPVCWVALTRALATPNARSSSSANYCRPKDAGTGIETLVVSRSPETARSLAEGAGW